MPPGKKSAQLRFDFLQITITGTISEFMRILGAVEKHVTEIASVTSLMNRAAIRFLPRVVVDLFDQCAVGSDVVTVELFVFPCQVESEYSVAPLVPFSKNRRQISRWLPE